MKTKWDYTNLADAYLKRPDYANQAIDTIIKRSQLRPGAPCCDVGAGVAHLTLKLAERGLNVTAVEPNDAMRCNGIKRTQSYPNVQWYEGVGENTGQQDDSFELVSFGSSFNVTDRLVALKETHRILKPAGWFVCMWNHRDLEDPIQSRIEEIIRSHIPNYSYGTRRERQEDIIDQSGLYHEVHFFEESVQHTQDVIDCIDAWRSHATLQRQAGDAFDDIVKEIEQMLLDVAVDQQIVVPYTTRVWMAQVKK